jgi:opacity protein-like surface antigen
VVRVPTARRSLLLAALALAIACPTASAAQIVAPCAGTTGDTAGLIAAINQANTAAGPDTVVLGQGCTYTILQQHNGWYGFTGLPPIASDITVEGNGATITRAANGFSYRFFFVGADPGRAETLNYVSPGAGSLTLRDVTLSGGLAKGGDSNAGGVGPVSAGPSSTRGRW